MRPNRSVPATTALVVWLLGSSIAGAAPPEEDLGGGPAPEPTSEPEPEPPPVASTPDAEVDALRTRVEALESELRAMQRERRDATPPPARPTQPVTLEPEQANTEAEPAPPPPKEGELEFNTAPDYRDGFHFGSYGRVVAGGDHRGRPGRNANIVAFGSRVDLSTYAELELRREDYWEATDSHTRIVATLAFAHPIFHYDARFDANMGIRNLYIEESGLGLERLKVWAGSRMYRGDDIYLLNFWPLDNLNTVGGGASYTFLDDLTIKLHTGINQPDHPFFLQTAQRPQPLGQVGDTTVRITDRQKYISSAKASNIFWVGKSGGGIKPVVYGEVHYTPKAQREITDQQFEELPGDFGWLLGTQLGLFTGKRSTHLNLVFRYAGGLAAYGEFNAPWQLGPTRTSKGAREVLAAASGNYERGAFGLLFGSYWRLFRNASPSLDATDLGEGIVILRPTVWFGKIAGLSVEGSYQAQRRGVLLTQGDGSARAQFGQVGRIGAIPFLTPAGRGNFARPHIQAFYMLTVRDDGARRLYPVHDVFSMRNVDHFIGIGAEWWFDSTSYFRD
jgi:maltoporin